MRSSPAGGQPDLAGTALVHVRAPTLLIVGGDDGHVIALNRGALGQLPCEKQFVIVPGTTHLFEEPGAIDEVARLARDWFPAPSRLADTTGYPGLENNQARKTGNVLLELPSAA